MKSISWVSTLVLIPGIFAAQTLQLLLPFSGSATDLSGNGLQPTISGAILVEDRFGNPNSAYYFDGIDDYIYYPHSAALNFDVNDEFAISVWYKAALNQNSSSSLTNVILAKWTDQSGAGTNQGYPFVIYRYNQTSAENGKLRPYRYDRSCGNLSALYGTISNLDTAYHHVVYQKSGSTLYLYVDGQLDAQIPDISVCTTANTDPLYVGRKGGSSGPVHFEGVIDDIAIFDGPLSIGQIDSLFHFQPDPCLEANLVAYYPFNGNTMDFSPNGFHANNYGATLTTDRFGSAQNAYQFDGIDDYMEIAHDSLLNPDYNENFSLSFWVKPDYQNDISNQTNVILGKWIDQSGAGTNQSYPYVVYRYNRSSATNIRGRIRFNRRDKVCNTTYSDTSVQIVDSWAFHHVVVIKEWDTVKVYVDNTLESSKYDNTLCQAANDNPLFLGRKGGTTGPGFFTGTIDDIVIYRGAICDARRDSLFNYPGSIGIVENQTENPLSIYPNPASDQITLEGLRSYSDVVIEVYDYSGVVYLKQKFYSPSNKISVQIDLLPKGIYVLRVFGMDESLTRQYKFLKN